MSDRTRTDVTIGGYTIHRAQRLQTEGYPRPHYAVSSKKKDRALAAIAIRARDFPRMDIFKTIVTEDTPGLLNAHELGHYLSPGLLDSASFLIIDCPPGPTLDCRVTRSNLKAMSSAEFIASFIMPAARTLSVIHELGMAHRAIYPGNIFYSAAHREVVLGECVSCAAGVHIPSAMEPLRYVDCLPLGKGEGTPADDMFNLGACIAELLFPGVSSAMSDTDRRYEDGSARTILNAGQFPRQIHELLSGLLEDNTDTRWTARQTLEWASGKSFARQNSTKKHKPKKWRFLGQTIVSEPHLAHTLHKDWGSAERVHADGSLARFLSTIVGNAPLAERFNGLASLYDDQTDEKFIARTLITMSPHGPVRLKTGGFMPSAVATLGMCDMDDAGYSRTIDLAWINGINGFWFEQAPRDAAVLAVRRRMDRGKTFIKQTGHGMGHTRAAYVVDQSLCCLSPKLETLCIHTPTSLLRTLNVLAENMPEKHGQLLDGHMISFFASRSRTRLDPIIIDIKNAETAAMRNFQEIRFLAEMQKEWKTGPLPALSNFAVDYADAALNQFHRSTTRSFLKKKLQSLRSGGDLSALIKWMNDSKMLRDDKDALKQAQREYCRYTVRLIDIVARFQLVHKISVETAMNVSLVFIKYISLASIIAIFAFRYFR